MLTPISPPTRAVDVSQIQFSDGIGCFSKMTLENKRQNQVNNALSKKYFSVKKTEKLHANHN